MAIAFRAKNENTGTGVTSLTITKPSGTTTDDVLIAVIALETNQTVTVPSGWTEIRVTSDGTMRQYAYSKVAGGAEPANYQWTFAAAVDVAGAIACYSGASTTTPVDVSSGQSNGNDTTPTAPDVTSTADNTMVIGLFGGNGTALISGTPAWTPPSGMTERVDVWHAYNGGDHEMGVHIAEVAQATAGATGAKTATITNSNALTATIGQLVVLKRVNTAPTAPTLGPPASAAIADLSGTPTFQWTHSDPEGDAQSKYAFRRKIGAGAYEYWNAGTVAWQAGEVFNATATQSVAFPAAQWTNGNVYNWSVRTEDPLGLQGPYASDFTITAEAPPVIDVTGPVGSVTGTVRPTVSWTYTDPNVQRGYQVRVFTAAQYGIGGFDPATSPATWDSGEVISEPARTVVVATDLAIGTTYRAYGRVSEAGPVYSTWDNVEFTINADQPQTPLLVATLEQANGRVKLDIQGRDNLLSKNQSSLETDAAGWAAVFNASIVRDTAQFVHGGASLKITATASDTYASAQTTTGTGGVPVVAAKSYRARASFRPGATARNVRVEIGWYNAAGTFLSTSSGADVAETLSAWTEVTLDAVAPANAAYAAVVARVASPAASEIHWVDKIGIAPETPTTWTTGGTLSTQRFVIETSDDAGATWRTMRGSPATAAGGANQLATIYDYAAPPNQARQYRTRAEYLGTTGYIAGSNSATASATLTATVWMLKDMTDSALNIELPLVGEPFKTSKQEDQQTFYPLGRANPIVLSDKIRGEQFQLRCYFRDAATYAAFDRLRAVQRTLLLQSDMVGLQWWVRLGPARGSDLLHTGGRATAPKRLVDITAVEVDEPA